MEEQQQNESDIPNFEVNIESPDQSIEDFKTLTNDITHQLKDILDDHGKKCVVKCFIHHFPDNEFKLGQVNETNINNQTRIITEKNDDSLFFYLNSTNRAFKNKKPPNVQKKYVNFNNPVDINSMVYVQSTKLIHLSDNEKQLREIILDENKNILEEDKAFDILSSLDFTLLVHMTNNVGLSLHLSDEEKLALMGLKEVRNNLMHKRDSISITELKHIAELMSHALYIFDKETWQFSNLHRKISFCFEVHNIKKMKAVLRAELLERTSDRNIISRRFKESIDEPDSQGLSVDVFCDKIVEECDKNTHSAIKFFVCGNTFSGRTSALFDIFRHWAQPGSKMNESFKIVLPMFSRNEDLKVDEDFRKSLSSFLKMWAPNFSGVYSFDEFYSLLLKECEDVLVIADTSQRNVAKIPLVWEGKSVETALDIDKYDDSTLRFHLANLTEKEVEEELLGAKSWYNQFCDKRLLCNPAYLKLFQNAYEHSTDRTNTEFAVMEVIAREAHANASKEDIEKVEKLCFEHIYRGEDEYTVSELESFYGSYFSFVNDAKMCLKSMSIEVYLASCYAAKNMQVAGWVWLKKPEPFKRVMKSVLKIWKDSNKLEENLKHFTNFLSVLTRLYVPENQRTRGKQIRNNQFSTWDTRNDIWSLEDEGYVRSVLEVRFNQWKFLSHILEATSREESIIECIRSVLIQCSSWVFSLKLCSLKENDQFNYLEYILRKVQLSADSSLELVKIQGQYSSYSTLPFIVKAIASIGGTPPPNCKSQIKLYFDRKFPDFKDDIKGSLYTFYSDLSDYPIPLTTFQGPLVSGNAFSFVKTPCFNFLTRLTVHIFDDLNLLKMLSVSLENLSVLDIALDFTKSDGPMSKVVQRKIREGKMTSMSLPASCRTKVAVRFTGDFKVLQLLSLIPKIHFLKLHGVYYSKYEDAGALFGDSLFELNVDCLFVKFSKCNYGDQKNEGVPWLFRVPLMLAKIVPNLSRLLISQIPCRPFTAVIPQGEVSTVSYFVHQVLHKLPNLLRIIIKDSEISIKEASHLLAIMDSREARRRDGAVWCCGRDLPVTNIKQQDCVAHCADMLYDLSKTVESYIDERLPRETLHINASQTETNQMELIITEAKHSIADEELKEAIAKSTSPSDISKLYDEAYYRNMPGFINQVQRAQLGRFCYLEYSRTHVIHRTEEGPNKKLSEIFHKPRRLQVLKNINKDIRINMDVPEFSDMTYATITEGSSTTNPCLASTLIPVFAVAQYLNISTGNLTAKKILSFVELLYDIKENLIRGEDKKVAPFSVTLNIKDEGELSREELVKNIKEQCALMGHRLAGHVRDDDDHEFHYLSLMHILYIRNTESWYLKKAHKGDIYSTFKELCHRNKQLD